MKQIHLRDLNEVHKKSLMLIKRNTHCNVDKEKVLDNIGFTVK